MNCRNCGNALASPDAVVCLNCGVAPLSGKNFCQNCGTATAENQIVCTKCGVSLTGRAAGAGEKSKVAAGLLGIFLGGLGIHKFYLGYSKEGVIMLLISLIGGIITVGIASGIVGIIGLIEGIIYLTKDDAAFEQTYVRNKKAWF